MNHEPPLTAITTMGTPLLFSFHYESNLPRILPNNLGITARLLCVASAHRLCLDVPTEGGNKRFASCRIKTPPHRCVTACCKQTRVHISASHVKTPSEQNRTSHVKQDILNSCRHTKTAADVSPSWFISADR